MTEDESKECLIREIARFGETSGLSNPPMGLRPRWLIEDLRLKEVNEAIERYMEAKMLVPQEWFEEQNYLQGRYMARGKIIKDLPEQAQKPQQGVPDDGLIIKRRLVVCKDNTGSCGLTRGKTYQVLSQCGDTIQVMADDEVTREYFTARFVSYQDWNAF